MIVKTNTNVVMPDMIKAVLRGSKGNTSSSEMIPKSPESGVNLPPNSDPSPVTEPGEEEEEINGTLSTREEIMEGQTERKGSWVGKLQSEKGDYVGYYQDLVKAIRGTELKV